MLSLNHGYGLILNSVYYPKDSRCDREISSKYILFVVSGHVFFFRHFFMSFGEYFRVLK